MSSEIFQLFMIAIWSFSLLWFWTVRAVALYIFLNFIMKNSLFGLICSDFLGLIFV